MGDHRVSIQIKFEMHDHKAKHDCWLNWSDSIPGDFAHWIMRQKDVAMSKFYDVEYEAEKVAAAERENLERDELARLKAKYEPSDGQ